METGRITSARILYERLRDMQPASPEICVNLGRVLASAGEDEEAQECYANAILLDPSYGNAYFNFGRPAVPAASL